MWSNDSTTYVLDDGQEILGCATLAFTSAIVDGKEEVIGYATDLRLKRKRKALVKWSENFLPVIVEERKKRKCRYIFSCVGKSHIQAYNAFIRPRTMRENFPRYHQYRNFDIISIHGKYPFADGPLNTIEVVPATNNDLEALQKYMASSQQKRTIYMPNKSENLVDLIEQWPGLSLDQFLLAKDKDKNIIGCVALWDPSSVERLKPIKKSKRVITFESTLYFLSFLRITRQLMLRKNPYLNYYQLNFINANNPDIFHALVHKAYKLTPRSHFLSYIHFEHQLNYFPPTDFIATKIPYGLYCLLSPEDKIPKFLTPAFTEDPPEFEMGYI
ncbi:MAG: hypothetical protein CL677_07930 [Bdellovibrionaceae bacterium]|nr:hypothetical protein [Pseudobdellovibrionaceae bacterium]